MAGRIPQNKVDEIYAIADIVEVVGEFITLKKKGQNFWGLSPWTNEKTPSFSVSANKGIFKDFSSGRGGNVVTFLMEHEGMTYVEALLYLAGKYNIEVEYEQYDDFEGTKDQRESLFVLNEFAGKYFREQLLESEKGKTIGLSYFKERGILESTMEEFGLGYSPDEWEAFAKAARDKQFNEEYLIESGLCIKSEKTQKLIDRFRGRVMFQIRDHLGKIVGFAGRTLSTNKKEAKYINSPESPIYHKSRVLFGLDLSKNAIRDEDQALLVEGYTDVISLYQNGVKNVLATSGTALTPDQIRLVKRFTRNVVLLYDGDEAGINAAIRGGELLLEQDMNVKVVILPDGHDPDSYVKNNGKTGFLEYVGQDAKDFVAFRMDLWSKQHDLSDPSIRSQFIHEAASAVAKIPDPVRRGIYMQEIAKGFGVTVDLVQSALNRATGAIRKQQQRDQRRQERREGVFSHPAAEKRIIPEQEYRERELLRILLNYSDAEITVNERETKVQDFVGKQMQAVKFKNEVHEKIRGVLGEQLAVGDKIDANAIFALQDKDVSDLASGLMAAPEEVSENWGKFEIRSPKPDENLTELVMKTVYYFKRDWLNDLRKQNQQQIKECKEDKKMNELLEVNMEIERQLKQVQEFIGMGGAKRSELPKEN